MVKNPKGGKSVKKQIGCILLATLFLCTGCGSGKGLKLGFRNRGHRSEPICAVKSSKTTFDIDDVTLNFYFSVGDGFKLSDKNYTFISIALYFCDSQFNAIPEYMEIIEDYRQLEEHYFIREIPADEYIAEDYDITIGRLLDDKFKHCETHTVPKEVMTDEKGSFSFRVAIINYSQKDKGYCLTDNGYIEIDYEYIDERRVRLS